MHLYEYFVIQEFQLPSQGLTLKRQHLLPYLPRQPSQVNLFNCTVKRGISSMTKGCLPFINMRNSFISDNYAQ